MRKEVFIGLTYGDPAGIGPEVVLKTIANWKFKLKPIVIGFKEYLYRNKLYKAKNKNLTFYFPQKNKIKHSYIKLGKPTKYTGLHSYECLKAATFLARNNCPLVTGPVSKSTISSLGFTFSGQTDEMAKLLKINPNNVIMLFVASDLRIALFTRHISLSSVKSRVTKDKLKKFLILLNTELKKYFFHNKKFKSYNPTIAVLGLNPHAGEDGMFGDEEIKVIKPVIKELNSSGLNIYGPFSPDAVLAGAGKNYLLKKKQEYDVYVSLYHDQALPMFKAVAGMKGVNVTLGLPFLRVSVDHGTAFDIAGKNKASNESMVSAIKLVEELL
ncbi:MAG: 4-hydroxythreonine-4-phosphate dehydrogenase PdxA [Candidatus Melainabacteria bacterium]|nr:4-hydroxythreonine-4-phosphate dehydrogenase PdxA [Candidatus Melainabacteria bacterium]